MNSINEEARKMFQQIRNTCHKQERPQFKNQNLRGKLQRKNQQQRQEKSYFHKHQVGRNLHWKNDGKRNSIPSFINNNMRRDTQLRLRPQSQRHGKTTKIYKHKVFCKHKSYSPKYKPRTKKKCVLTSMIQKAIKKCIPDTQRSKVHDANAKISTTI